MKRSLPVPGWIPKITSTLILSLAATVGAQDAKPAPVNPAASAPTAPAVTTPATTTPAAATPAVAEKPPMGLHKEAFVGPDLSDHLDKVIHGSKSPTSWLKWGADLRVRNEYLDNAVSLNGQAPRHEQDWLRVRARLWSTLTLVTNYDLNIRLAWEGREYFKTRYAPAPYTTTNGWDWSEGIIDNLNFKVKEPGNLPLTFTVGRQDMLIADGLLFADGTPLDGSRTYYFDDARLTFNAKECKTTIDVVGIWQYAKNDAWLPPINHLVKLQTEQDEQGAVLYISNKLLKDTQLDGYFIYKHDDPVTYQNRRSGNRSDIYALGGRVAGNVTTNLSYRVEGAYEFGEKEDPNMVNPALRVSRDMSAFALNSAVTYSVKDRLNNAFRLQFEYISGDDPNSKGVDEQFDLLWGRWPRWSELYIYSMANETRVAECVNLIRVGPGWSINPTKKLTFSADYYALLADQSVPTRARNPSLFTGTGNFRGHMLAGILKYRHNEHISAHLWSEFVFMGDYYAHRDLMQFLRAEVMFTW